MAQNHFPLLIYPFLSHDSLNEEEKKGYIQGDSDLDDTQKERESGHPNPTKFFVMGSRGSFLQILKKTPISGMDENIGKNEKNPESREKNVQNF